MVYQVTALGALTILLQVILPVIVAIVTKTSGNAGAKAITLLALTSVTQFVSGMIDNFDHFDWKTYALNVTVGFAVAVASHYGLWKPTGISGVAGSIGPQ